VGIHGLYYSAVREESGDFKFCEIAGNIHLSPIVRTRTEDVVVYHLTTLAGMHGSLGLNASSAVEFKVYFKVPRKVDEVELHKTDFGVCSAVFS